jgi:hypothetical protein
MAASYCRLLVILVANSSQCTKHMDDAVRNIVRKQ